MSFSYFSLLFAFFSFIPRGGENLTFSPPLLCLHFGAVGDPLNRLRPSYSNHECGRNSFSTKPKVRKVVQNKLIDFDPFNLLGKCLMEKTIERKLWKLFHHERHFHYIFVVIKYIKSILYLLYIEVNSANVLLPSFCDLEDK